MNNGKVVLHIRETLFVRRQRRQENLLVREYEHSFPLWLDNRLRLDRYGPRQR